MTGVRKLTTLSHEIKREICKHKQKNPLLTNRELVAWVEEKHAEKVHEATISRLLKNSFALLANSTANNVKRSRAALNPPVEEALYKWFLVAQEAKFIISDDLLIEKAKLLHAAVQAQNPQVKDCQYSNGWLVGFKRRHTIRLYVLQGEKESAVLTEASWDLFSALRAKISTYAPQDVFNLDETALFFRLQPNKTLRDQIFAVKKEKERLSVGLCANMDGSIKLKPVVIHKWKMPRSFSRRKIKNVENLGVHWYSNKKAWMKGDVFQDWVTKFDQHMMSLGKKQVALIIDNAPGHVWKTIEKSLKVTKVFCLPPNTTARFQPMDAGIIQSFKCHYRKLFVRKQLVDFEKSVPFKMDVYHAVMFIVQAWTEGVTQSTIKNCWRHCDLQPEHQDNRPNRCARDFDLNDTLKDSDIDASVEELGETMRQLKFLYPVDLTPEEYLEVDSVQNAPTFDVEAPIESFLRSDTVDSEGEGEEAVDGDDGDSDGEQEERESHEEPEFMHMTYGIGMSHFAALRHFFQQQEYDTNAMTLELNKIQKLCQKEHTQSLVQTSLAKYY